MTETEITESLRLFAENAKRMREAHGLTLKDLQNITGLTDTYIVNVENKRANISINNAHKIAEALKTPLYVLLIPQK